MRVDQSDVMESSGRRIVSRLTEIGAKIEQVLYPGSRVVPEVIDGRHYWSVYAPEKFDVSEFYFKEAEKNLRGSEQCKTS